MHQFIGQLARAGQQQQTFGIQIEPPDGLPFAMKQPGQTAKHGGPVLRIVMRDHLASGLVVGNDARRWRADLHADRLAVDLDGVAKLDALADVSGFGVDRNAAFQNQLLHFQARTESGLGQHLVQLGRFGQRRKHALEFECAVFFVGVKLAGDDIFKADRGRLSRRGAPLGRRWRGSWRRLWGRFKGWRNIGGGRVLWVHGFTFI